ILFANNLNDISKSSHGPACWYLPDLRILQPIWKGLGDPAFQGCLSRRRFRPYRVEIHEPRLEQPSRYRFQRLAHPPIQLDLVVQRAEDVGDGALFDERWKRNRGGAQYPEVCVRYTRLDSMLTNVVLLLDRREHVVEEERVCHVSIYCQLHLTLRDAVAIERSIWNEAYLTERSPL